MASNFKNNNKKRNYDYIYNYNDDNNHKNNHNERCRKCFKVFLKHDCISCSTCNKWFHFKCSNLSFEVFQEHVKDKERNWECKYCLTNKCKTCDKLVNSRQNSICCDLCNKWIHLKSR